MTDVSDHIEDQDPAVYTSNGSLTSERGVMRTSSSVLVEERSTEPYLNRHHYGLDILVSGLVLGLGIGSVVLPWGSSSNDHSLAAVPGDLPYMLPLLVVLMAAVLLSIFRVTRRSCYVILMIAGLWWADYLLGDLVSTGRAHGQSRQGCVLRSDRRRTGLRIWLVCLDQIQGSSPRRQSELADLGGCDIPVGRVLGRWRLATKVPRRPPLHFRRAVCKRIARFGLAQLSRISQRNYIVER